MVYEFEGKVTWRYMKISLFLIGGTLLAFFATGCQNNRVQLISKELIFFSLAHSPSYSFQDAHDKEGNLYDPLYPLSQKLTSFTPSRCFAYQNEYHSAFSFQGEEALPILDERQRYTRTYSFLSSHVGWEKTVYQSTPPWMKAMALADSQYPIKIKNIELSVMNLGQVDSYTTYEAYGTVSYEAHPIQISPNCEIKFDNVEATMPYRLRFADLGDRWKVTSKNLTDPIYLSKETDTGNPYIASQ